MHLFQIHVSISFAGFHLGFSSRGANTTIAELRGGKDYSNTSNVFSLARNIIDLKGYWGHASQEIFLIFNVRLFLVAYETNFSNLGRRLLPVHG